MKFQMMIRSRADANQEIAAKHGAFTSGLRAAGVAWGMKNFEIPAPGDIGGDLALDVTLTNSLVSGIKGSLHYVYRGGLRDDPMWDDYMNFEFNPATIQYTTLLGGGIQRYVRAFGAYYAFIGNREFAQLDFNEWRKFNGRDHVFRMNQVCFMDRELCNRSFKMEPEQIAAMLEGELERVELLCGGILLVICTTPLEVDQERDQGDRIKALLLAAMESQK